MNSISTIVRTLSAWGIACVVSGSALVAAVPQPPVDATAERTITKKVQDGAEQIVYTANFRWQPNPKGDAADGYRIYYLSQGSTQWKLLTSVAEALKYQLTEKELPLAEREYYFYISAFNKDGESGPAGKLRVAFPKQESKQEGTVYFVSTPPDKAAIGVPYKYDADAIARSGAVVHYSLASSAEGATIDSETGVVSWTPTSAGDYKFLVQATPTDNPSKVAAQPWVVHIAATDQSGSKEQLVFVSKPVEQVDNGLLYAYDANVKWSGKGDVRYILRHAPEGATVDAKTGLVLWKPTEEGYVKFQLDAVAERDAATVQASQAWAVKVGAAKPKVKFPVLSFTTEPMEEAAAHVQYVYNAHAQWEAEGDMKFMLVAAPAGASVDENGRVTWTPNAEGEYKFLLRASAENMKVHSEAAQAWVVRVYGEAGGPVGEVATGVGNALAAVQAAVYPNPASAECAIRFEAQGSAVVVIVDESGRIVYTEKQAAQGTTIIPVDASKFAAGRYFVRIETGGQVQTLPLSILR